jgi:hypothetical protein
MARDLIRPARRAIEKYAMTSACRIEYDAEGSGDDETDLETGQVFRPLDDSALIYDQNSLGDGGRSLAHPSGLGGLCYIGPVQATRSVGLQIAGGARLTTAPYEIMIPLDGPDVEVGAVIECTHSDFPTSDPALAGQQFTVRQVQTGSLQPARVLITEMRERGPD